MDKYQLIDGIIGQIDALVDMRGVEKCRTALDAVGKLVALKKGLADDDAANERRIETLERQIQAAAPAEDEDTETIDGRTYRIGETADSREER